MERLKLNLIRKKVGTTEATEAVYLSWWNCYRWMTMEGSSRSSWQRTDSSRGLNTSGVSDRDPRLNYTNRIDFLGDASHNSEHTKERETVMLAHTDQLENQVGFSADCEDEVADSFVRGAVEWGDVSLSQWLDKPERAVDAVECLHIFKQIVEHHVR